MNDRQKELFHNIILEHIKSAKAVGSEFLVEKYNLGVSSATIRNDMVELEHDGLIHQPHISAGRVPTEKGYNYYIENYLKGDFRINEKDKTLLDRARQDVRKSDSRTVEKYLAKTLAEMAHVAAIYSPDKNDTYYTGLSNLFAQPEFTDLNLIYNITEVVDNLDEVLGQIFDQIKETEIKLGQANCFSPNCASILTKKGGKLFGLVGPIRMDYERNLGLVNYVRELIN